MARQTRKQKERERIAIMCDKIAGGKSKSAKHLRRTNRKIDMKKGQTRHREE
jgi:hypothetical protein